MLILHPAFHLLSYILPGDPKVGLRPQRNICSVCIRLHVSAKNDSHHPVHYKNTERRRRGDFTTVFRAQIQLWNTKLSLTHILHHSMVYKVDSCKFPFSEKSSSNTTLLASPLNMQAFSGYCYKLLRIQTYPVWISVAKDFPDRGLLSFKVGFSFRLILVPSREQCDKQNECCSMLQMLQFLAQFCLRIFLQSVACGKWRLALWTIYRVYALDSPADLLVTSTWFDSSTVSYKNYVSVSHLEGRWFRSFGRLPPYFLSNKH